MTRKKTSKEIPMTGQDLYDQTKCTWRTYLEAALVAGNRKCVDPMEQLKEFRAMAVEQAVKELVGHG